MGWNRGEAHLVACFIWSSDLIFFCPFSISGIYAGERMSNPFIACGSQHNMFRNIWMIKWMIRNKRFLDEEHLLQNREELVMYVIKMSLTGKVVLCFCWWVSGNAGVSNLFLRLDSIGVFFLKVEPKCLLCHNLKESEPLPSTQYK